MGRERRFKGTDAEIALARFLCETTDSLGLDTVDKVVRRFPRGGSRSTWAQYLNGATVIPRPLLREVLQELRRTRPGSWSGHVLVEANKLWKAAAEGTPPPQGSSSTELVSLYRRLTETTEALNKAQAVAANTERVIPQLLQLSGRQETKISELTYEVEQLRERERTQAAQRLEQAQFRLARIQAELERARNDRYTAEQAQAVLVREQQEARREIERLQQAAADLDQTGAEPTLLPQRAPEPAISDEEFDHGVDEQLDLIITDREERGAMLYEVLEQARMEPETEEDGSRIIPGTVITEPAPAPGHASRPASPAPSETVQGLSRTTSDNLAAGYGTPAHGPAASPKWWKTRRPRGWLAVALLLNAGWLSGDSLPVGLPTDPDLHITGNQEFNTAGIMGLPDCKNSPSASIDSSVDQEPTVPLLGGIVTFKVSYRHISGKPCRFDLGRKATTLQVTGPATGVWSSVGTWSSADCVSPDTPPRWARLETSHPLTVTFRWHFQKPAPECTTPPKENFFHNPGIYTYDLTASSAPGASVPGRSGFWFQAKN